MTKRKAAALVQTFPHPGRSGLGLVWYVSAATSAIAMACDAIAKAFLEWKATRFRRYFSHGVRKRAQEATVPVPQCKQANFSPVSISAGTACPRNALQNARLRRLARDQFRDWRLARDGLVGVKMKF